MLQLKKELNAIGNNYNQAVKKLHTLDRDQEVKKWVVENEIVRQKFLRLTEQIFFKMNQIHEQWSSG